MQSLRLYLLICSFLVVAVAKAQGYEVRYLRADTAGGPLPSFLQRKFTVQYEAATYLQKLPADLQSRGYLAASVDSVRFDSLAAEVALYLGEQYHWATIRTAPQDAALLDALRWPSGGLAQKPLNWEQWAGWQQRILDYLEERGHPFGKVQLDSMILEAGTVSGRLLIDRGPAYTIDSLRIVGNAQVRPEVLERYLDMPKGSAYNRRKLEAISARIRELAYVQETAPATVSLQGTGAIINLHLQPRKSSQLNALVGFLPNSKEGGTKMQFTGEANVLLRNSLGAGETIGLNWQQLQVSSPRLTLLYQHPYLFQSPVGLLFNFEMLRKDSSWLNLNFNFGGTYALGGNRTASIFLQRRQTILSTVDTTAIKFSRRLPLLADVASNNLGVSYTVTTTDYRFNPRRGWEFSVTGTAGTKKVRRNSQVLEIKDTSFNYARLYDTVKLSTYQLRMTAMAARYTPMGKQSVLKTGINAGLFQSGSYYFNELFQVGGYKLLRGFTEESEFLSHYLVGTAEYRYLIGPNSYFFGFVDGGWGRNNAAGGVNYKYIGTGLGLSLETGAGIFNLAWAVGRRNDTELNLRQSKVHLGFVNYF